MTDSVSFHLVASTQRKDLLTLARQSGGNIFVDLLWSTGLAEDLLTSKTPYTLVVPTDESFKNLPTIVKTKLRDTCFLRKVLRHHIVKGEEKLTSSDANRVIMSVEKTPILYNNIKVIFCVF